MEKRNYLKPITELNEIMNPSFMAGSSIVFDDDSQEFQGLLDDCLQLAGDVTNDQLKTYLLTQTNNTACFKGWTESESGALSCTDTRFSDNVGVTIKYDETNGKFILTFSGCSGWVTDPAGNAGNHGGGSGRPN